MGPLEVERQKVLDSITNTIVRLRSTTCLRWDHGHSSAHWLLQARGEQVKRAEQNKSGRLQRFWQRFKVWRLIPAGNRTHTTLNRLICLIPGKYREGILGDILEEVEDQRDRGTDEREIRRYVLWECTKSVIYGLWGWITRIIPGLPVSGGK